MIRTEEELKEDERIVNAELAVAVQLSLDHETPPYAHQPRVDVRMPRPTLRRTSTACRNWRRQG